MKNVVENVEVTVSPDLREWILVGFAEGTVGYNHLKGNMDALGNEEETFVWRRRSCIFSQRVRLRASGLLTAAYDSRRVEADTPLMQRIDPQRWYVLYGDDTLRGHDAPSRKKTLFKNRES